MTKQDFYMVCLRHFNSPKNKEKRRKRASAGGKAKFEKYRSIEPIREDHPGDIYELRFTNIITGEVKTLLYHPGDRSNNFSIDVNGKHWKTCGINESLKLLGKSMYKLSRQY